MYDCTHSTSTNGTTVPTCTHHCTVLGVLYYRSKLDNCTSASTTVMSTVNTELVLLLVPVLIFIHRVDQYASKKHCTVTLQYEHSSAYCTLGNDE
jgi:hypothetical protein